LLVLVPFQKIQLDGRTRVIIITGLTAAGYVVLVYLMGMSRRMLKKEGRRCSP
jgi:hypothetical protein